MSLNILILSLIGITGGTPITISEFIEIHNSDLDICYNHIFPFGMLRTLSQSMEQEIKGYSISDAYSLFNLGEMPTSSHLVTYKVSPTIKQLYLAMRKGFERWIVYTGEACVGIKDVDSDFISAGRYPISFSTESSMRTIGTIYDNLMIPLPPQYVTPSFIFPNMRSNHLITGILYRSLDSTVNWTGLAFTVRNETTDYLKTSTNLDRRINAEVPLIYFFNYWMRLRPNSVKFMYYNHYTPHVIFTNPQFTHQSIYNQIQKAIDSIPDRYLNTSNPWILNIFAGHNYLNALNKFYNLAICLDIYLNDYREDLDIRYLQVADYKDALLEARRYMLNETLSPDLAPEDCIPMGYTTRIMSATELLEALENNVIPQTAFFILSSFPKMAFSVQFRRKGNIVSSTSTTDQIHLDYTFKMLDVLSGFNQTVGLSGYLSGLNIGNFAGGIKRYQNFLAIRGRPPRMNIEGTWRDFSAEWQGDQGNYTHRVWEESPEEVIRTLALNYIQESYMSHARFAGVNCTIVNVTSAPSTVVDFLDITNLISAYSKDICLYNSIILGASDIALCIKDIRSITWIIDAYYDVLYSGYYPDDLGLMPWVFYRERANFDEFLTIFHPWLTETEKTTLFFHIFYRSPHNTGYRAHVNMSDLDYVDQPGLNLLALQTWGILVVLITLPLLYLFVFIITITGLIMDIVSYYY